MSDNTTRFVPDFELIVNTMDGMSLCKKTPIERESNMKNGFKRWLELGRKIEEVKTLAEQISYGDKSEDHMSTEEEGLYDLKKSVENWVKKVEAATDLKEETFEEFSKTVDRLKNETCVLSVLFHNMNGTSEQRALRKGLYLGIEYQKVKCEVGEMYKEPKRGQLTEEKKEKFNLNDRLNDWRLQVENVDPEKLGEIEEFWNTLDRFKRDTLALTERNEKKRKRYDF